jgi:MFS family permease
VKQVFHKDSSIWRHRDARIALPARAFSTFGDDVVLVALTLRLFDEGQGAWAVTALLVCAAAPAVVLAPLAGRLADAVPFRLLAAVAAALQTVCCAALAFVGPAWALYALVVALQAGNTVTGPAWQALMPALVPAHDLGRLVAAAQSTTTIAAVAAPFAAGVAVATIGFEAAFLLDAVTFAALVAAALRVRATRGERFDRAPATAQPFRLRSDALLWPLATGLCALVVAGEVVNVVEVFLVRGDLGANAAAYGVVSAVLAAGVVAGAASTRNDVADGRRAVRAAGAALVLALALLAAGVAPTLLVFAVAWAVVGVANGIVNADASTVVLRRTPDASRGRTIARLTAMTRGSALCAMALGGLLGALLGPRGSFVASGVVATVVAVIVFARVRRAVAHGSPVAEEVVA